MINGEDTGSNYNRTVRLEISTGKVFVKRSGGLLREL